MDHSQEPLDHPRSSRQAKRTAGSFDPRETIDDFSQAAAVEFCETGQIEDNVGVLVAKELVKGQFKLLALHAHLKRSAQFENDDARLRFLLDDLHKNLPRDRTILRDKSGKSQLESASIPGLGFFAEVALLAVSSPS